MKFAIAFDVFVDNDTDEIEIDLIFGCFIIAKSISSMKAGLPKNAN